MKYGIICAMEEELKELLAKLEDRTEKTIGGIDFYEGKLAKKPEIGRAHV